jgi:hypothetical protein
MKTTHEFKSDRGQWVAVDMKEIVIHDKENKVAFMGTFSEAEDLLSSLTEALHKARRESLKHTGRYETNTEIIH